MRCSFRREEVRRSKDLLGVVWMVEMLDDPMQAGSTWSLGDGVQLWFERLVGVRVRGLVEWR